MSNMFKIFNQYTWSERGMRNASEDRNPKLYIDFSHFFNKNHKDYENYQDRAFELWHDIGYNNAIDKDWIETSPYKKDLEMFIYKTNIK